MLRMRAAPKDGTTNTSFGTVFTLGKGEWPW